MFFEQNDNTISKCLIPFQRKHRTLCVCVRRLATADERAQDFAHGCKKSTNNSIYVLTSIWRTGGNIAYFDPVPSLFWHHFHDLFPFLDNWCSITPFSIWCAHCANILCLHEIVFFQVSSNVFQQSYECMRRMDP